MVESKNALIAQNPEASLFGFISLPSWPGSTSSYFLTNSYLLHCNVPKGNSSAKQAKYTYDIEKFRQQLDTHIIAPKLCQTEPFYYQRRVQRMECVHLACQSKLDNPR